MTFALDDGCRGQEILRQTGAQYPERRDLTFQTVRGGRLEPSLPENGSEAPKQLPHSCKPLHSLEADVGPPARVNDRDVGWQVDSEQIHCGCAPAGVLPVDWKYREPIAAVTDICVPRAEVAMHEG